MMRLSPLLLPTLFLTGQGQPGITGFGGMAVNRQASQVMPSVGTPLTPSVGTPLTAQVDPCAPVVAGAATPSPGSPCAPVVAPTPAPPTMPPMPPTPPPAPATSTIAPTPPPPPPVYVQPVCLADLSLAPGTFTPWTVYKYLKVNTPFIDTPPKDIIGGQTVKFLNAGTPIYASNFTCVAEANEWKARVLDSRPNTLTMERDNGMGLNNQPEIVSLCLLQDISLYRSVSGMPALRLDYGHCVVGPDPNASSKQAFFMIGLKKVPDGTRHPNVKGFFEDVCGDAANETLWDAALELSKAHGPADNGTCFATSADMEDFRSLDDGKCFPEGVAYQMLDPHNKWPVLPVPESDWNWFDTVLPIGAHPSDDACASLVPKKMYGRVEMDRVCLEFEGIACSNGCGSWCAAKEELNAKTTTTPEKYVPPPICLDCEWQETAYALFATFFALMFSYYTYLAYAQKQKTMWMYTSVPADDVKNDQMDFKPSLTAKNANNYSAVLQRGAYLGAIVGLGVCTFVWSVLMYYLANLLDTLITVHIIGWQQCIRVWSWQYYFDKDYYNEVNGTWTKYVEGLHADDARTTWTWSFPAPRKDLNIDVCYGRLWGMILVTWLSLWALMVWWRRNAKAPAKEIIVIEKVIEEEEGGGVTTAEGGDVNTPIGGMYTNFMKSFV